MWGKLLTTCSKSTEVAQWGIPSCSRPQPATDNGVRDDRFNWLVAPSTLMGSTPWALVHSINLCSSATARIQSCNLATFCMRGNYLAYAATLGIAAKEYNGKKNARIFYQHSQDALGLIINKENHVYLCCYYVLWLRSVKYNSVHCLCNYYPPIRSNTHRPLH